MNTSHNQLSRISFFLVFSILIMLLFSTCTPQVHYLGDRLQPTTEIDVYYDENDVEWEYRTIGKMTHSNMLDYEAETIKNKMIQKAKANGGDGIIFLDVQNIQGQHPDDFLGDEDRLSITAKVIKYKRE